MSGEEAMVAVKTILKAYPQQPQMGELFRFVDVHYPQYSEGILIGLSLGVAWVGRAIRKGSDAE